MKTPIHRQSHPTALSLVAFATLVFTTAPAATRVSRPQRVEADWLLAEKVAAVVEPSVRAATYGRRL